MWRCFVRDQARVPSVAGAGSSLFRNRNSFFLGGGHAGAGDSPGGTGDVRKSFTPLFTLQQQLPPDRAPWTPRAKAHTVLWGRERCKLSPTGSSPILRRFGTDFAPFRNQERFMFDLDLPPCAVP